MYYNKYLKYKSKYLKLKKHCAGNIKFKLVCDCDDFIDMNRIPDRFVEGETDNMQIPSLIIKNIPDGTKSLTLIMDDPDASRVIGKTYVHWIVKNIPRNGNILEGIIQRNTKGTYEYYGPNPPPNTGTHHYSFIVYALYNKINDDISEITNIEFQKKYNEMIIDKAILLGTFDRKN